MDISESLVGAYLRHRRGCHTIAFNQFIPGKQGEIDVIGIAGDGVEQRVYLVEIAVHLENLNYGGPDATVGKVRDKIATALEYARKTYRDHSVVVEFWSPRVPPGIAVRLGELDDVDLVINEDFTARVNELAELAGQSTKQFGDEAFRFLQILTHLRGPKPTFGDQLSASTPSAGAAPPLPPRDAFSTKLN